MNPPTERPSGNFFGATGSSTQPAPQPQPTSVASATETQPCKGYQSEGPANFPEIEIGENDEMWHRCSYCGKRWKTHKSVALHMAAAGRAASKKRKNSESKKDGNECKKADSKDEVCPDSEEECEDEREKSDE